LQIAFEQLQFASDRIPKSESGRMIFPKMDVLSLAFVMLVVGWKAGAEIGVC
jgi:hypothetical protein